MENWKSTLLGLLFLSVSPFLQAEIVIEQWEAEKGVPVYFVENHSLPIVDVSVVINAGSAQDPENRAGVAALTEGLLAKGAGDMDENALSDALADLGAVLGGAAGRLSSEVTLRTLSDNYKKSLSIFLDVLTKPHFTLPVFERERNNLRLELQDALTRPNILARRAFIRALYPNHPFGVLTTDQTLSKITRDDLVKFHQQYYVAANLKIVIVGDLKKSAAKKMANQIAVSFMDGEKTPAITAPQPLKDKETRKVPHPAAQSHILMGQITIARSDPDYFPMLVGNYTLGGGGFASRLMQEVREKEGLAYSVYSAFAAGVESGTFEMALQTERTQAPKALALMNKVVADFVKDGPSDAEVEAAKAYLSGSFPLNIDSNKKIMRQVIHIATHNLPLDTLNTWQARINAVTTDEVKAAYQKHLKPETFLLVQTDAQE